MFFLLCATSRAMQSFKQVLTLVPEFARRGEIHLRLGVMFKTKGDYNSSNHHFKQASQLSGPASFSKLESEYCLNNSCFWEIHYYNSSYNSQLIVGQCRGRVLCLIRIMTVPRIMIMSVWPIGVCV